MSYGDQKQKGKFLTDTQRKYLKGVHEPPNDNATYQMRSKIRGRIEGALEDLFLMNNLSDDDLKNLFKGVGEITTENKDTVISTPDGSRDIAPGFEAEISAIIAAAYRGYVQHDIDPDEFVSSRVGSGIKWAVSDLRNISSDRVSVDIETTTTVYDNIDELGERFDESGPEAISEQEAWLLYQDGEIEANELSQVLGRIDE